MTRKSARIFKEGRSYCCCIKKWGDWKKTLKESEKDWNTFMVASYKTIVEELGRDHFGNLIKGYEPREFKEKNPLDFFNPHEIDIAKYITELAGTKVTMVTDWTRQIIGAMVLDAQENNLTMDELAKNIKNEYTEFSRYRAYRIARTEAQNALGYAHYTAGEKAQELLGETLYGEWVTSEDDRVRDSHADNPWGKSEIRSSFL